MKYFRGAMPVLLQLVTHPSFNLADHADQTARKPLHCLGEAVSACLERHRVNGEIADDPARIRTAMLTLMATLHGLALFERMRLHGGAFPDAAVRNIADLLVAGLEPRKGGRK